MAEGEIIGIREALSWIKALRYTKCFIESDCQIACNAINSREENFTELGVYVEVCRNEIVAITEVKVKYIRRDLNTIAYKLTRIAFDFVTLHV